VFVAIATGAIPGSDGTITACYANSTGRLRVIDTGATPPEHCSSKESQVSWNQQGPAGPPGPAGPAGPAGPQGAASCDAARPLVCPDADLADGESVKLILDGFSFLENVHTFRASCTTADSCTIILADQGAAPLSVSAWYQTAASGDPTARRDFTLVVVDAGDDPISKFFVHRGTPSALLYDGDHWQLTLTAEVLQQLAP
jgi:hypothetical protein